MLSSGRILIVDDDPLKLKASSRVLSGAGYTIHAATTGQEALDSITDIKPELVLLDVVLPDIPGLEVCRQIKQNPALNDCFVVLYSATRTGSLDKAIGLEEGADGYLTKPISNRELLARINTFLRLKRTEIALRNSESDLRDVIMSNADGMIVVDQEGIVRFANSAAEALFGAARAPLREQPFGFPIADKQATEIDIIRPGNSVITVEMRVVTIQWEQQPAYLASLRDISDRKRAEEQRIALAVEHEKLLFLSSFIEDISHEVSTPITSVILTLDRIKRLAPLDEKLSHAVEHSKEQLFYLNDILKSMLYLARMETSAQDNPAVFDLNTLVQDIATRIQPEVQAGKLALQLQIAPTPLLIKGEPEFVKKAVQHIVDNAIQYTGQGGTIQISTFSQKSTVGIAVQDTGIGISEHDLPNIFTHFYRVDKARTERSAGLGLTIAQKIIEGYQGTIDVQSQFGVGSTFKITLPAANSKN
jgi:signal transduction histidine kinase